MAPGRRPAGPGLTSLLRPYAGAIAALATLTIVANALNLLVPRLIADAIDGYVQNQAVVASTSRALLLAAAGIFGFTVLQSVVQVYASERVARDLRTRLADKIARQDYASVQQLTPAMLLTHLTSDVDAIKMFVAQAIASLIASAFLIVGASVLLLAIDWRLGLTVIATLPVIGGTFFVVFGRVRRLFTESQQAIDRLNRVINESILGAALIRLLNSQQQEYGKFLAANTQARDISLRILRLFAGLIPVIMFSTNMATLAIVLLGGRFVMQGSMTLGDFAAFNSYLALLIFPVIMIGFMSNVMAQASASFQRVNRVLTAADGRPGGSVAAELRGDVALRHVVLTLGGKAVLKDVSLTAAAGSRTAIIGPTAAGKTQILHLLARLLTPDSGIVEYDGRNIEDYDLETLHRQVGFVFQDSVIFNLTVRENIAFSRTVTDQALRQAIETAELSAFVAGLPQRLDTVVAERGASLSGGQKQRIMLARALALDPRVLLLDDFTARVDVDTERRILGNVRRNYPHLTLVSVTQQIAAVEDYDQIVLLMEGEVLAVGTHQQLMTTSPEYVQIYDSQRSTSSYRLHAR
jgi:ATP-binding cassette, subfamily B, bacterial